MSESEVPTSTHPDRSPEADTFDDLREEVVNVVEAAGLNANDNKTAVTALSGKKGQRVLIAQIGEFDYPDWAGYKHLSFKDKAIKPGSIVIGVSHLKGVPGFRKSHTTHIIYDPVEDTAKIFEYVNPPGFFSADFVPDREKINGNGGKMVTDGMGLRGRFGIPEDWRTRKEWQADEVPNMRFGAPKFERHITQTLKSVTAEIKAGKIHPAR